jgi:hypothetical protein
MLEQGPRYRRPHDAAALRFYRERVGRTVSVAQAQKALEALRQRTPTRVWKSARGEYALQDAAMHRWYEIRAGAGTWPPEPQQGPLHAEDDGWSPAPGSVREDHQRRPPTPRLVESHSRGQRNHGNHHGNHAGLQWLHRPRKQAESAVSIASWYVAHGDLMPIDWIRRSCGSQLQVRKATLVNRHGIHRSESAHTSSGASLAGCAREQATTPCNRAAKQSRFLPVDSAKAVEGPIDPFAMTALTQCAHRYRHLASVPSEAEPLHASRQSDFQVAHGHPGPR